MLAVEAPLAAIEAVLAEERLELVIANRNAPSQAVLSGATAEIEKAQGVFSNRKLRNKRLAVSAAFHSPLVADVEGPFLHALENVEFSPAQIPVYANRTATEYPSDAADARKLLSSQLAHPVEFVKEIENLHNAGVRTFLEVGPGAKLTGLVKATLGSKAFHALAIDASNGKQPGMLDLARALAQLAALGHSINLNAWEPLDASSAPVVHKFAVPICGANYRAAKKGATGSGSGTAALPARAVASGPSTNTGSKLPVAHASISAHTISPTPVAKTATPMTAKNSNAAPLPANQAEAALRLTQENLAALQRIHEQTAQLHQQFLAGQEQAQRTFQALIEQQQRLFTGGAPASLPVPVSRPVSIPAPAPVTPVRAQSRVTPSVTTRVDLPVVATPAPKAQPQFEKGLLEVVAEKTGYPVEMLNLEMQLDADLGIDSIKRVEILSALQERFPSAPQVQSDQIGSLRTLKQVVEYMNTGGGGESVATDTGELIAVREDAAPAPRSSNSSHFEKVLLEVVAEKTGYPVEMLNLDMQLDADLGIDSIKRVEILSALQEKLPDAPQVQSDQIGSLRTLRQSRGIHERRKRLARSRPERKWERERQAC